MKVARFFVAPLFACALGASVTACGDEDEEETLDVGTCDLRVSSSSCIELHGASSANLDAQEEGCIGAGGDWSNDACPTDALVGCCDYSFGSDFRECFYVGITRDPEAYCMMFDDGVYTPAN